MTGSPEEAMRDAGADRSTNAGYVLAIVMFLLFALGIVGFAFMTLAGSETRASQQTLDSQRAFWLAEGGRNRALAWMTRQAVPPITEVQVYTDEPGPGGGTYSVDCRIDSTTLAQGELGYLFDCVGESRGLRRRLVQRIRQTGFARFAYFTDDEIIPGDGFVWHSTGEVIEGPMHSNGTIRIAGSPRFQGLVTSASAHMIGYPSYWITNPDQFPIGGNAPLFEQGARLGVHAVPLPATPADLLQQSQTGGVYAPRETDLELGVMGNGIGTPSAGWFRYRNRPPTVPSWNSVRISGLAKKVFCCGENLHVKGVLDGELTVAGCRDIRIEDNILYAASSAQGEPLPGCDDLLGLVAGRNIVFVDNPANRIDLTVDGILMALDCVIQTENYTTPPPRGTLTVWGGLIQKYQGRIGTMSGSTVVTGYRSDYHYDARVTDRMPPGFPLTGIYREIAWTEEPDDAQTF
jgi:hypothetical protein